MSLKDSLKILVVDDTSVSRGLVCMSLEQLGFRNVDSVSSGQEAFKFATTSGAHLVICDQNMPGMTGVDLLRTLRSNASTARIGFILISGSMSQELVNSARQFGLNNFLPKPFDTTKLRTCLQSVVGAF